MRALRIADQLPGDSADLIEAIAALRQTWEAAAQNLACSLKRRNGGVAPGCVVHAQDASEQPARATVF